MLEGSVAGVDNKRREVVAFMRDVAAQSHISAELLTSRSAIFTRCANTTVELLASQSFLTCMQLQRYVQAANNRQYLLIND